MLDRLKDTLVRSYVGAIALGYLLASCIWHFADIFSTPISAWVSQKAYRTILPNTSVPATLEINPLRYALPELARFICLALVWYFLMRWLYLRPVAGKETAIATTTDPG